MKNDRLNTVLNSANGKFLGFTIQNKRMRQPQTFSGKVVSVTDSYVTVQPYSGMSRNVTKIHKSSLVKVVGFGGLEYNRN